jgi:hypothetical protein
MSAGAVTLYIALFVIFILLGLPICIIIYMGSKNMFAIGVIIGMFIHFNMCVLIGDAVLFIVNKRKK